MLNLENHTQFSCTPTFRPNRGVCSVGGGGGGKRVMLGEWSDSSIKLLIRSLCCERYGSVSCGRGGGGIFFVRVVWLLCQTSDQVPVLREIMKVVMDTQRMPVNLSGWLKTVKGNVAFVKVWKYNVIHDLPASRGLISHSGRVASLNDTRRPKVRHFLLLNALTLPNLYCQVSLLL